MYLSIPFIFTIYLSIDADDELELHETDLNEFIELL